MKTSACCSHNSPPGIVTHSPPAPCKRSVLGAVAISTICPARAFADEALQSRVTASHSHPSDCTSQPVTQSRRLITGAIVPISFQRGASGSFHFVSLPLWAPLQPCQLLEPRRHVAMPHTSRSPEPSTLKEYESVLKRCTYKVACQNRCDLDDTKPCSCLEHIVHVDDLMQWWHEKIPGGSGQTKLTRLAAELPDPKHRPFPFYSANNLEILNGDQSYLTVLSILLAINRANLIDIFYDSGMTHHLDIVRDDNNGRLRENLRKKIDPQEVDVILRDFHKERWAFCPLKLSLNMDHHLQGSKVIPPFCHKVPLSSKGATASIYWVAVQENLVSDESLKRTINDSLYQDPTYGKVCCSVSIEGCYKADSYVSVIKWY
jgi:hypothetical protein